MKGLPTSCKKALVCHLLRQSMPKRVLEVREEPTLIEELGGLEVTETATKDFVSLFGNGLQEGEEYVLACTGYLFVRQKRRKIG